jgi:hypothetical protein
MNLPAVLHIGSRCGQGFMESVRVDFKLVVQIPGSANHVKVLRERGSWSATLVDLIGDTVLHGIVDAFRDRSAECARTPCGKTPAPLARELTHGLR